MFNFTDVSTSEFTPLEAGWYKAFIDEASFQTTKSGTGEYLKVTFKVDNRNIFGMYNLLNNNPKAVEIAMRDVTALLEACGHDKSTLGNVDKTDLLALIDQKELMIKLKIESNEQYGDQNRVCGYKALPGEPKVTDDIGF